MKYISTRGQAPVLNFEEVLLTGLASDGGLYVPETLPYYSPEEIISWSNLSYNELAFKIIVPFVADTMPQADLKKIIDESYDSFRHKAIAPLSQLDRNEWLLELYHGPTLAFKDFALQLLGNLLDYVLEKRQERVVIMGATSGDTGSAAIEGCRRCKYVDMFILHPHNRVSDVQRKQMTTVIADNIHNLAIEGNFDDCQEIVKTSFRNQAFLKGRKLVAVNSINWARIMAQIVYYFYASLSIGGPVKSISFSVPTGNFGDIFAGYLARKMGLPIQNLIIATNKNDILDRILQHNDHTHKPLSHTLSPSMDIVISSNFERLLFDLYHQDGKEVVSLMENFKQQKNIKIDAHRIEKARAIFDSHSVDDQATCDTINDIYKTADKIVDPHTAIGIKAGRECRKDPTIPLITLATAHPAKFAEAVEKSGIDKVTLPHHLADLLARKEAFEVLPNNVDTIQNYVATTLKL